MPVSIDAADIRTIVAAKITEILDFQESPESPDFLNKTPETIINKAFGVWTPLSEEKQERQSKFHYQTTEFTVNFYIALRNGSINDDINDGIKLEKTIEDKIKEITDFQTHWNNSERSSDETQSYNLHSVTFTATHIIY